MGYLFRVRSCYVFFMVLFFYAFVRFHIAYSTLHEHKYSVIAAINDALSCAPPPPSPLPLTTARSLMLLMHAQATSFSLKLRRALHIWLLVLRALPAVREAPLPTLWRQWIPLSCSANVPLRARKKTSQAITAGKDSSARRCWRLLTHSDGFCLFPLFAHRRLMTPLPLDARSWDKTFLMAAWEQSGVLWAMMLLLVAATSSHLSSDTV